MDEHRVSFGVQRIEQHLGMRCCHIREASHDRRFLSGNRKPQSGQGPHQDIDSFPVIAAFERGMARCLEHIDLAEKLCRHAPI